MIKLEDLEQRKVVSRLYDDYEHRFPFIHAVIGGLQNGEVFVDNSHNPNAAFVCHQFGWCQIIGFEKNFLSELDDFLFKKEFFCSYKLRAFCPEFMHVKVFERYAERSERRRYLIANLGSHSDNEMITGSSRSSFTFQAINEQNITAANHKLGLDLFNRYWPSEAAFKKYATGYLAFEGIEPIAICYSCARMDRVVEIDVFAAPEYRRIGAAKRVCNAFINECAQQNLQPSWDCFTNNIGSMLLAKKLGFTAASNPYDFFTYNRQQASS